MANSDAWADVLIKIDSDYHKRALIHQIELCGTKRVEEKDIRKVRILLGIANALNMLLDQPDQSAYLMHLRLQATKATSPPLMVGETEEVMKVIVKLTSPEARQLAIDTSGKKVWPSLS